MGTGGESDLSADGAKGRPSKQKADSKQVEAALTVPSIVMSQTPKRQIGGGASSQTATFSDWMAATPNVEWYLGTLGVLMIAAVLLARSSWSKASVAMSAGGASPTTSAANQSAPTAPGTGHATPTCTASGPANGSASVAVFNMAEFQAFQNNYLFVYLLCLFSDWLKGPYVYALYEQYGFSTDQIAWLFAGGFLSSLVFGTFVGALSDKYGRKFMCIVFCVTYGLSAVTKVFPSFAILFLGRVLSGISTSLLFTSFESWMVTEHHTRQFPEALLTNTFVKQTLGNGLVAILAGFVAQGAASCCGYAAPFLVAIPCLSFAGWHVSQWRENYGNRSVRPLETITLGIAAITSDSKLLWLGTCQSIFEACMYLWVFFWTPAVSLPSEKELIPYGLLFASYMAALMIGGAIAQNWQASLSNLAVAMHLMAASSMALAALFFDQKGLVFLMCTIFEGSVGVYFPCHGTLRAHYVPDHTRSAVMNVFRFPMNAMVIIVLSLMPTPRTAFLLLAASHLVSLFALRRFQRLIATSNGSTSSSTGVVGGRDV